MRKIMSVSLILVAAALLVVLGISAQGGIYASEVVNYTPGTGGSKIDPVANGVQALGAPDAGTSINENTFVRMGQNGSITLKMSSPFTGSLDVYEVTGGSYPLESASVYVSNDAVDWTDIGDATNTNGSSLQRVTTLQVSGCWEYVKIVDNNSQTEDAFDLDAVVGQTPCQITITVDIDIKPGSDPSCFNNDGNGVIPVAILGSATLDVYQIDAGTVALEGLAVQARGKSNKLQASYEDVNGDGFIDLVVQIEDVDGTFTQGSGFATLTGNLLDGTPIAGTGDICITQ